MAAREHADVQIQCPCCYNPFLNPSLLGLHLRRQAVDVDPTACKPCTVQHKEALERLNLGECNACKLWFMRNPNGNGVFRHSCKPSQVPTIQDVPEQIQAIVIQQPVGNFLDSILAFMDANVSWEDLKFCHFGSMSEVKPVHKEWNAAFAPVLELIQRGDINLSFKLLLFTSRVCTQPSKKEIGLAFDSQRKRIKTLVRRFLQGDFRALWDEQAALTFTFDDAPDQLIEGDRLPDSVVKRARGHAKAGQLSRSIMALKSTPRADPNKQDVQEALRHTHPDADPDDQLPELPDDLATNDLLYKFHITTVQVPTANGIHEDRCSVVEALRGMKRRVTQSLTGMRNEHFMSLDPKITSALCDWILNNKFTGEARQILIAGKGFGLHKTAAPPPQVGKGDLRPCARGEVLRSIADRIMVVQENPSLRPKFIEAQQYGVGVKGGIEYAYHSSRLHLLHMLHEEDTADQQYDDAAIPGMDQLDCANAFQMFSRAAALRWLLTNKLNLVRKFIFCYGIPARISYVWEGMIVFELLSCRGSQQGSVDGGHNFVFASMQFAQQLIIIAPNSHITWIMDDLTVVGPQSEREAVAEYLITEGPKYGLIQSKKEGANNSFSANISELHLSRGFKHCPRGLKRLLGAPLGDMDFMKESAANEVDKLTKAVKHLYRIADSHFEGVLLRYCFCSTISHMCRLIPPEAMIDGLDIFEDRMRQQLARIARIEDHTAQEIEAAFEIAKLPVRTIGIGLGDVRLTAPSAFASSIGAVARLAESINLPLSNHLLQVIQTDPYAKDVFNVLSMSTPDTPNPICPALTDVTKTPSQSSMSDVLYNTKTAAIIEAMKPRFNQRHDRDAVRRATKNVRKSLFFLSQMQFGAGKEYDTIPINQQDHLDNVSYAYNLRLRLGIETRYNIITDCGTSFANHRHNAMRRIMIDMYTALEEVPLQEPAGLLKAPVNILRRPADIGILPAVHGTEKLLALDVSVVSPVTSNFVSTGRNFNPKPLQAALAKEKQKLDENNEWVAREAIDPVYKKMPVVFESTGAMGESAQDWFKMVMILFHRKFPEGICRSSPIGLERHWGATSFQAHYHQKFALSLAKSRGKSFWHSQVVPLGP